MNAINCGLVTLKVRMPIKSKDFGICCCVFDIPGIPCSKLKSFLSFKESKVSKFHEHLLKSG